MDKYIQTYMKLRKKYDKLMEGRHGFDKLSRDLLVLWFVVMLLNGFIRNKWVSLVSLICPIISVLRALSVNDVKRGIENRKYLEILKSVRKSFLLLTKKFHDRKTYKYVKCKNCDAVIRVKRVGGKHIVACPKCRKEFAVRIIGKNKNSEGM